MGCRAAADRAVFATIGDKLPGMLCDELDNLRDRLG
jgi:hypothetical protein